MQIKKIELNDSEEIKLVDNYIKSKKETTIFNTIEWTKVLAETYNYDPLILVNKNQEQITAFITLLEINSFITGKRLVSLPFSTYSGFLFDDKKSLNNLIGFLKKETKARNCQYLEIKQNFKIKTDLVEKEHYFDSVLDLTKTEEELWKNFDKGTVRWGIKKAQKSNLKVEEENTIGGYKKFYNLMIETRKKQGSPPYPFTLFKNILKYLKENSKLYLAHYNEMPIAGLVLFYLNKTVHYLYAASKKEKEYLQYQPNNLLLWEAIKWSKKNNYEKFDFGITPPEHHSLLKFKSRWGTIDIKIPYYFYLNKRNKIPLYDSSSFGSVKKIWSRFPKFLIKLIGPRILRHFG